MGNDTMKPLLVESIDLAIDVLGLNEEFDLGPPMNEVARHANDLSQLIESQAGVECVERLLLGHENKFARTLGAIALRFASQLGDEVVSPLLPLLYDAHPWARYHALWALAASRSLRHDVLSALGEVVARPVQHAKPDSAEAQSQRMASAYLTDVELRRRDVERLAFEEYVEPSVGLRIPRPIGWQPREGTAHGMRWKLAFDLAHPSEMIQLQPNDPPEVTQMLTIVTGVEDTVEEIARANCPEEWVHERPSVEVLGDRGGWLAVFTSHEVHTVPNCHNVRCFLGKGDTLAIWSSVVPRVDLTLWHQPLETIAKSITG